MLKHRLYGFTLLEMIITMIISSIMIVLFYAVMNNLYKEWTVFKEHQNEITETLLFKQTLDGDLRNARYVIQTDERKVFFMSMRDTVTYQFSNHIVRSQGMRIDTFGIILSAFQLIPLQSMKRVILVSEISMDIERPIEMKEVSFYKHYTSSDLMDLHTEQDGY
ncbi:MAG: prepilin-type N-terminal cleavage/methylation domain-containing protein [Sphingobacteriales bacterium]|nr:MAG: prepilin-type N-terminal cleavage/methylation domain-containing protein [Sphingobacteriales bacterium]